MQGRTDQPTFATARAEVAAMRAAIATLRPDGNVRMSRDQFVHLAQIIDCLSNRSIPPDQDSFVAPIDDIRWWVPLPEHQRVLSQLDAARSSLAGMDRDAMTASSFRVSVST